MTPEGVGETEALADALGFKVTFCFRSSDELRSAVRLQPLLQALRYFGQVIPFSTLSAAFVSFHSAPQFFCRSRAAASPPEAGFFVLVAFGAAVVVAGAFCATALPENGAVGVRLPRRRLLQEMPPSISGVLPTAWTSITQPPSG
jgi:hypothetical protein